MNIFYSKAKHGFYRSDFHDDLPDDAVEITAALHRELLDGQATGKMIAAGANGWPKLVDPPTPEAVVPTRITRFQARAALLQAGLLADVEAAVAASDNPLIQLAWADSIEFPRSSPTIAALAETLGLTGSEIDALFVAGAAISA